MKPCPFYIVCLLIDQGVISISRGRELLNIKYMEEMRKVYNKYLKEK